MDNEHRQVEDQILKANSIGVLDDILNRHSFELYENPELMELWEIQVDRLLSASMYDMKDAVYD